jgi:hypothetical protein
MGNMAALKGGQKYKIGYNYAIKDIEVFYLHQYITKLDM